MGREGADRLIISYDAATTSVFALSQAAAGLVEIIWLVDLSDAQMARTARLLRRLGTVVDSAGLSLTQTIESLRGAGPTGIMAVTDSRMTRLADIAVGLELPFHAPAVAERLSDKQVQRQALREAGVAVPPFWEIPATLDRARAAALAAQVQFPVVLKPRRGDGSRRVRSVLDVEELLRFIGHPDARSVEPAGWMIEGYLPGVGHPVSNFADVVSVESFVADGAVHHLTVTGRLPFADPFRETGSVLPSDISAADADAAQQEATRAITGLGLRQGCVHTELKFTPDGPCIVEVNGRIGGGIPELMSLAGADIDLLRFGMERALGMPMTTQLPLSFSRVAYRRIVTPPVWASRIATMSGQDALKDVPGVDEVTINRLAGDAVDWQLGLEEFVYSVYGSADSYDEVAQRCDRIDHTVHIDYEEIGVGAGGGSDETEPDIDAPFPFAAAWRRAGRGVGARTRG